jgi:TRAP-type mannitol/chloroaromatic compound transport system substrate-binding protein
MKDKALFPFTIAVLFFFVIAGYTPALAAPPAPAGKPTVIEWRLQSIFPKGARDFKWLTTSPDSFVSLVKEASGGRVIIKPFAAGELVPALEALEAVRRGGLDAQISGPPYWAGKIPACNMTWLSFILQEPSDIDTWMINLGVVDLLREPYKQYGNYLVSCGFTNHGYLLSKKPISTAGDFKGMKIRATGIAGDVLQRAGASMVYLPAAELYMALQTGVVDAATYGGFPVMVDLGLHEVASYLLTSPPLAVGTLDLTVNIEKWQALPDDLKAIIKHAALVHTYNFGRFLKLEGELMIRELVEKGRVKATKMPPHEQAKMRALALAFLEDYCKKDAVAKQALEKLKDYLNVQAFVK